VIIRLFRQFTNIFILYKSRLNFGGKNL